MKKITIKRIAALSILVALSGVGQAKEYGTEQGFVSDVVGVKEPMLGPGYWLSKLDANARSEILLTSEQIAGFNRDAVEQTGYLVDLQALPARLTSQSLVEKIESLSRPASADRFYADGSQVTEGDYRRYAAALNLDSLKKKAVTIEPKYGMVVARTIMRSYPTEDRIFKKDLDLDLDRFQETGLFPGQELVIYHESADGEWYFAQSYNYAAWVQKKDVAVGSREQVFGFHSDKEFLVVTGDRVFTTFTPEEPRVSQQQLDMGVRLPLVPRYEAPAALHGQNTYASYIVEMPVRNKDGSLEFSRALIARSRDVNIGYLPFTRENLIRQSFKFLGERYGWGHDYNGRDCTGFVGEVYKTFGMLMPRNSGQQGSSDSGRNVRFGNAASLQDKKAAFASIDVGDLIYIPGHVMMYLGDVEGKPFIIHDVNGLAYYDAKGEFYRGTLNGVSVTPLLPLQLSRDSSYLDKVYNIKRLR
ncbi:SH3 domain-containing protein [Biformimicrobium ophioploci]|uniref:SH3 domain-containing protein n=1 Tax=Biformimicrobium ophioploci TaxID=3036711 RepID=UPI002556CC08|nr:SH3 domain-containing protein [Microbulbifer sp. NKW57]